MEGGRAEKKGEVRRGLCQPRSSSGQNDPIAVLVTHGYPRRGVRAAVWTTKMLKAECSVDEIIFPFELPSSEGWLRAVHPLHAVVALFYYRRSEGQPTNLRSTLQHALRKSRILRIDETLFLGSTVPTLSTVQAAMREPFTSEHLPPTRTQPVERQATVYTWQRKEDKNTL